MTIGVGQDSFDSLRNTNTLYCGMCKAIFTVVKGCKENQALLQPNATATTEASTSGSGGVSSKSKDSEQEAMDLGEAQDPTVAEK